MSYCIKQNFIGVIFSSPGRNQGRAIVLPQVSTLALALASALAGLAKC